MDLTTNNTRCPAITLHWTRWSTFRGFPGIQRILNGTRQSFWPLASPLFYIRFALFAIPSVGSIRTIVPEEAAVATESLNGFMRRRLRIFYCCSSSSPCYLKRNQTEPMRLIGNRNEFFSSSHLPSFAVLHIDWIGAKKVDHVKWWIANASK